MAAPKGMQAYQKPNTESMVYFAGKKAKGKKKGSHSPAPGRKLELGGGLKVNKVAGVKDAAAQAYAHEAASAADAEEYNAHNKKKRSNYVSQSLACTRSCLSLSCVEWVLCFMPACCHDDCSLIHHCMNGSQSIKLAFDQTFRMLGWLGLNTKGEPLQQGRFG